MSKPATIETALADIIRGGEIGADTVIRCWHALLHDAALSTSQDRHFPCIDIRCSSPVPDATFTAFKCTVQITGASQADDDADHAAINALESAITSALFRLTYQSRHRSGADYTAFKAAFDAAEFPAVFGGIVMLDSQIPQDDQNLLTAETTLEIHYSQATH